jgi:hypothetical protein
MWIVGAMLTAVGKLVVVEVSPTPFPFTKHCTTPFLARYLMVTVTSVALAIVVVATEVLADDLLITKVPVVDAAALVK